MKYSRRKQKVSLTIKYQMGDGAVQIAQLSPALMDIVENVAIVVRS